MFLSFKQNHLSPHFLCAIVLHFLPVFLILIWLLWAAGAKLLRSCSLFVPQSCACLAALKLISSVKSSSFAFNIHAPDTFIKRNTRSNNSFLVVLPRLFSFYVVEEDTFLLELLFVFSEGASKAGEALSRYARPSFFIYWVWRRDTLHTSRCCLRSRLTQSLAQSIVTHTRSVDTSYLSISLARVTNSQAEPCGL